jgi:hypothetical protein
LLPLDAQGKQQGCAMIFPTFVSTDTFLYRRQKNNARRWVFLLVVALHLLISAFLVRQSRFASLRQAQSDSVFVFAPGVSAPAKPTDQHEPTIAQSRKPASDSRKQPDAASPEPEEVPAPMFVVPNLIDWDSEIDFGVKGSLANSQKEHGYRNLSGLSNAQLAWLRQYRLTPPGSNPFWYDENADKTGPAWFADHCKIVGIIIYCTVKVGHRKPRGDLFKDMRKYLEDRITEPLP